MRINPIISYGQSKCNKPCKQANNTGFTGGFYDTRARDAAKDLAGGHAEYVVNLGESKFLTTYHGWDDRKHKYVLKAELDQDYFDSRDSRVQTQVKRMIDQAERRDCLDYKKDKTGRIEFYDINHPIGLEQISNLAFQLRPYEQYNTDYPYVHKEPNYIKS